MRVGATLAVARNVGLTQRLVQCKNATIMSLRGPKGRGNLLVPGELTKMFQKWHHFGGYPYFSVLKIAMSYREIAASPPLGGSSQ